MTTRTYRINLVGEPADTARALSALETLFEGDALLLLREALRSDGLTVQRLVADATEVVLYITAGAAAAAPPPDDDEDVVSAHGGGGGSSTEEPPR